MSLVDTLTVVHVAAVGAILLLLSLFVLYLSVVVP